MCNTLYTHNYKLMKWQPGRVLPLCHCIKCYGIVIGLVPCAIIRLSIRSNARSHIGLYAVQKWRSSSNRLFIAIIGEMGRFVGSSFFKRPPLSKLCKFTSKFSQMCKPQIMSNHFCQKFFCIFCRFLFYNG